MMESPKYNCVKGVYGEQAVQTGAGQRIQEKCLQEHEMDRTPMHLKELRGYLYNQQTVWGWISGKYIETKQI